MVPRVVIVCCRPQLKESTSKKFHLYTMIEALLVSLFYLFAASCSSILDPTSRLFETRPPKFEPRWKFIDDGLKRLNLRHLSPELPSMKCRDYRHFSDGLDRLKRIVESIRILVKVNASQDLQKAYIDYELPGADGPMVSAAAKDSAGPVDQIMASVGDLLFKDDNIISTKPNTLNACAAGTQLVMIITAKVGQRIAFGDRLYCYFSIPDVCKCGRVYGAPI